MSSMFETLVSDVKGQIEQKVLNNGNVDVKGWSFSNTHGVCPTRLKYDGIIKSVDIDVRKDICEKFNKNNVILAGWHTSVPTNKYIDIQMKIGGEWTSILSFNTFNMVPEIVKVTESVQNINLASSTKNEIVYPDNKLIDNIINNIIQNNPNKSINKDDVVVIDFQTNISQIPNLLIVDNFYNNPDSVRSYGLLSFQDKTLNNTIKEIDAFRQHFQKLLGTKITNFDKYEHLGGFSTSTAGDKIIFDTKKHQFIALIFLQKNAPINTGITLYRSKNTGKMTVEENERNSVFKNSNLDSTEFEPVDIIGNLFNRLVIFNTKQIHAISNHFGITNDNSRLVQTFAFDVEVQNTDSSNVTKLSFNM